ncbi:HIT-like protein [Cantharellus anzutake]|uniref:HIT-like protein n=1 Tax=Cantharellus anzutake TaxID=1750568 RepID=UPI001905A9B4|nr:HIT-like protein [Cantharellus anzutake]KAF8333506.1 HIT-like protein [Cantharellus anzutake]
MSASSPLCIFCKIIKGEIPALKLVETEKVISFLDINPLAKGHSLVIPKYHAEKFHELPDDYVSDVLPVAKKIAVASGLSNYNILQNNGRIAHQEVPHVHFHVIPKPSESENEGLVVGWPAHQVPNDQLKQVWEEIKGKL